MSIHLLSLLKSATPDRHQKAVAGLRDGTLIVTLTRQEEHEIRALVTNGDGSEYGVTLTEHGAFCSCKDSLYRGSVCKHAVVTALFCLQLQPVVERIHLMHDDESILCGHTLTSTSRWWKRWTRNALNWSDLVCQGCVHTYQQSHTAALRLAA